MSAVAKRVVFVVVAELRAEAIERYSLFHVGRLLARGARTSGTRAVAPDSSLSRLATILTGVSPGRHGVISDRPPVQGTLNRLDPIGACITSEGFQVSAFLPDMAPHEKAAARFIGRELGFQHLSFKGAGATEVVRSALNALCTQRRGLIAVHLSDLTRLSGHEWMSPAYAQAAHRVDQSVGLLATLSGSSSGESLFMLLVNHGSDAALGMSGPRVADREIAGTSLLDLPATILWTLGIPVPRNYEGRPLVEAFESAIHDLRQVDSRPMHSRRGALHVTG